MKKINHSLIWLLLLFFSFIICSSTFAEVPMLPGTQENTSLNPFTFRNYSLDIPECTSNLVVSISNGTGELDLFMREVEPFVAESYTDLVRQSFARSDTPGTADESIEIKILTPDILPIRVYIAPVNWNDYATHFTLSNWLETGMPIPAKSELFLTYDPIEKPLANSTPDLAQPIGTGDIAWGGGTISIQIKTCPFIDPVDMYFAIQASYLPELYMLTSDGTLHPNSLVGLALWKTGITDAVNEMPFGDIRMSDLPPGTYYLYLAAAPEGTLDHFYLWSTFFKIGGPSAPDNIKPYLDLVVDDTVIDFGRLDNKRRNLGIGPALGTIPVYPYPVPPYTAPNVNLQNLCTYISGGTYLKTLPLLPLTDPNHIDPDQYPDGMTCVYAVVADSDAEAINVQHVLPEPMFGRGNIYTAISIPDGVPAGTLIDNYQTMNAYNALVSAYANNGLLSIQPHFRSVGAPEALSPFTAPVEPLRTPPREFPYVIAFNQGGNPDGTNVTASQILSESPNPLDPLGLQPSGTIFKVIVEAGDWGQGNARGYIWMIPVTDDFWDLRHSNGAGDPGLWVDGQRVATLAYVGQAIPIIWEAPDDPDVEQSTHDRRHVNPDAIPAGGTVQLEARVQDAVNPQDTAFAQVAWPVDDSNSSNNIIAIDQNSGNSKCVVEWDNFKLNGGAMHFDAISQDLNANIELNFINKTIVGSFSGTLVTDYDPLWHQTYLLPFASEGSYSGQVASGAIEIYENDKGETHAKFTGDVNIYLDLLGGRTLKRYDSSLREYVTYYVEGNENINVVGEIRGSTESGTLRIVWLQVIDGTMPQGFYLTWDGLSSLFEQ